jgi:hypothetical protein
MYTELLRDEELEMIYDFKIYLDICSQRQMFSVVRLAETDGFYDCLSISPAVLSKTHHTSVKCVLSTAL